MKKRLIRPRNIILVLVGLTAVGIALALYTNYATIALVAAIAMFAQDVISAPLTQAQARNNYHMAGQLDTVGYLVAITTTLISVNALNGHSLVEKVLVIGFVSVANYTGMYLGTWLGQRYVKEELDPVPPLTARVVELERRMDELTEEAA